MLDSWSHWLTLAQESRHKCPCVCSGASEADWGASDEISAFLPSCWWNQGASERTTERINQLTRFCTAKFCTFSMSWALGLVWLEGGGEDKLPLTQKPEGISGFHLWSKAPMITGFMQLNPFKGQESGAIRNRFAKLTWLGQWMGRNRPCEYCVDRGESMACLSEHSAWIV